MLINKNKNYRGKCSLWLWDWKRGGFDVVEAELTGFNDKMNIVFEKVGNQDES